MAKLLYVKGYDPIKICPACNLVSKTMKGTLQKWARDPTKPDGLAVYCRACKRERDQRRYLANKEWAGIEALRKWMGEGLDEIQDPGGDGVSSLFPTNR